MPIRFAILTGMKRIVSVAVLVFSCSCGDGIPDGLNCQERDDCVEGAICYLPIDQARDLFNAGPDTNNVEACRQITAGVCAEQINMNPGCFCLFGPTLDIPIGGAELVCS